MPAKTGRGRRRYEPGDAAARLRCRVRGTKAMQGVLHDLRFTVRNLARSPGLAAVIALSLALGIGANTAIFGLIRTVMLKSLPVEAAGRPGVRHTGRGS